MEKVHNWINGEPLSPHSNQWLEKHSPVTGELLSLLARSEVEDVNQAISGADEARSDWAGKSPVARGDHLYRIAQKLEENKEAMARVVAAETGKSFGDALGETGGAIALARYFAGEGQRLYGSTLTSGDPGKVGVLHREPIGIAGLVIAANTPIANVAWKVFPALICGNTAVLKAAEDTPNTALLFAQLSKQAGLPDGVLQVIQGLGTEAGRALVAHPSVRVVSFTGSSGVGKEIAGVCSQRLARVSLELGGKNPFVVLDDADLDRAVRFASLSAFSNAGQRCASASRYIVTDGIYERFRDAFVEAAKGLRVGPSDDDDLGPVINKKQFDHILSSVAAAVDQGAKLLTGGGPSAALEHGGGYFVAPTILENVSPQAEVSRRELFGPVACLYRVSSIDEAIKLANDSDYGLTATVHTRDYESAMKFASLVETGLVSINAATYGSEPHWPFGGVKSSGNGTREPGLQAIDVYSEFKNIVHTGFVRSLDG